MPGRPRKTPPAQLAPKKMPSPEELEAEQKIRDMHIMVKAPKIAQMLAEPKERLKEADDILPDRYHSVVSVHNLDEKWQKLATDYQVPVGYINEIAIMFLDGRSRRTMRELILNRAKLAMQIPGYNWQYEVRIALHVNTIIRRIFYTLKSNPKVFWDTHQVPSDKRRKPELDY